MIKPLKKLYIPSGLIASMYNLYGGNGRENNCLSEYDVQLLCSYMEFYMNYTNINSKKAVYWFYSLPQFYNANENEVLDLETDAENNKIRRSYVSKVLNENVELLPVAEKLEKVKQQVIWDALRRGMKKELDPVFDRQDDPAIDYARLAKNPFEYGVKINKKGFRVDELYSRKRKSKIVPNKEFFVFLQRRKEDKSTFFILNPENSRRNMTGEAFRQKDLEMQQYLRRYFKSDSYKVFASDKKENFAPDERVVVDCFKKAVRAYNQLELANYNQSYTSRIKSASQKADAGSVGIEMVDE